MPVKTRLPKIRRPVFDRETLDLFERLEGLPAKDRRSFSAAARELAIKLNLTDAYWTGNSPLDRSARPCHPEGYAAFDDWHICRRIRRALLDAVVERHRGSAAATAGGTNDDGGPINVPARPASALSD